MAYLFIEENKINGCGEVPAIDETTINYEITDEFYQKFQQNPEQYVWDIETQEPVIDPEYEAKIAQARKQEFLKQFFKIDGYGYFRKQPKGYGSAVESLNTAFNIVTVLGNLPANTLTFYAEPDFTIPEQCTEEWLVENATKNEEMTPSEFGTFYAQFMMAWNMQEHL